MTVDEIRALVRQTTMVDSGDLSDAQLLLWINEAIMDVSMRYDWPWLQGNDTFATVASTRAYALSDLSDELQEILYVIRTDDDQPLHPISMQAAYTRWGDDFPDGTPKWFFIHEEDFNLVPVPDAIETIKVYYVKPPTELTQATDEPAWITTFHSVVVPFVECKVWEQQEDFAKANYSYQKYLDRLDMMKRTYSSRLNFGPWVMGAGRGTRTGRNEPFRDSWSNADV